MGKNEYYIKIRHINVSYITHFYPFLMNTIHKSDMLLCLAICFLKKSYYLCILFIKNEYYIKIGHINVSYFDIVLIFSNILVTNWRH